MSQVDVEAVLTDLAAKKGQKLDWRKSIVDLMKLLDLDSSLDARKELAQGAELYRRHLRLRIHERLAAQAGHGQARGERRQGARRPQGLGQGVLLHMGAVRLPAALFQPLHGRQVELAKAK